MSGGLLLGLSRRAPLVAGRNEALLKVVPRGPVERASSEVVFVMVCECVFVSSCHEPCKACLVLAFVCLDVCK